MPPRKAAAKAPVLRNRIVERGEADPAELTANPGNWRTHTDEQKAIMRAMLQRIGFVAPVIVNRKTGHLVDGHLRVEIATEDGESVIPVDFVDITAAEERLVLAAYDPLSSLAGMDPMAQVELLMEVDTSADALGRMVEDMLGESMPVAAAAAALEGMPEEDAKSRISEGFSRPGDMIKVVIQANALRIIETALASVGTKNRGDAMTAICRAYLEGVGLEVPE